MTSLLSRYEDECIFYGTGMVSVIAIIPLLHSGELHDDIAETTMYNRMTSDSFEVAVYSTLGVAVPLLLDLGNDITLRKMQVKQLISRAWLCFTLVLPSCLHVYYSLSKKIVYATWVVMSIRGVLLSSVIEGLLKYRSRHIIPAKYFYMTHILFSIGSVLKSYVIYSTTVYVIGRVIRVISWVVLAIIISRHLYIAATRANAQDWYEKHQQFAVQILAVAILLVNTSLLMYYRQRSNTQLEAEMLGIVEFFIVGNVFTVLLLSVITSEYRHDYAQLQEKLSAKGMFVRHVSEEVRTPLNTCCLGIACMKKMIHSPTKDVIDEMRVILDEVLQSCDSAINFMNNLLLYEKIDSKELPLYPKCEDLTVICTKVFESLQAGANHAGVDLRLDIHELLVNRPSTSSLEPGTGCERTEADQCIATTGTLQSELFALVNIDAPKIAIALSNLLANAIKYTPKGGNVSLCVLPVFDSPGSKLNFSFKSQISDRFHSRSSEDSQADDVNASHIRVIISDSGHGMTEGEQMKYFSKIVQFSLNDNIHKGSDIGMFLAHHIMKGHDLAIQVYSKGVKGGGTHYYVDFPLMSREDSIPISNVVVEESLSAWLCLCSELKTCWGKSSLSESSVLVDTVPPVEEPHGTSTQPALPMTSVKSNKELNLQAKDWGAVSVLIVDDSALNRKMLVRTLRQQKFGASHDCVCDGVELLSLFGVPETEDAPPGRGGIISADNNVPPVGIIENDSSYDVILLDDNMPHMNGSVAVNRLRQFGYKGLVVGVTGSALEEDMQAFCRAGVDYAMPKPFVVSDFIKLMESHK